MSIVLRSLSKASWKQSKSKEIYDTIRKYRSRANSSIVRFPLLNKYREHRRERSEEKVSDQTERKIFFSLANSKRSFDSLRGKQNNLNKQSLSDSINGYLLAKSWNSDSLKFVPQIIILQLFVI